MKPSFEFQANSAAPDDKSGVATWRYTVQARGDDFEVVATQWFPSYEAASGINRLIAAAWADGEAVGYANCERRVLAGLRDGP